MEDPGFLSGLLHFVAFTLLGIAFIALSRRRRDTIPFQIRLFVIAITLRYAMSLLIYMGGLVNVIKDEDASGWILGAYYNNAWQEEKIGLFGLPAVLAKAFEGNNRGYYYMLGLMFYFTSSPCRLAAAALNCFVGALGVVFSYRISETLFSNYVATRVGWWLVLFPSMIIWSAQTIKEPTVILLEILVIYGCVSIRSQGLKTSYIVVSVVALLLTVTFRFYATYICAMALILGLLAPRGRGLRFSPGAVLGAALVVGLLLGPAAPMVRQQAIFDSFDQNYIKSVREWGAIGGSGVDMPIDLESTGGVGVSLVVGGLHLLLAPFPWHFATGSLRMLMVGPEMLFWWWLFFVGLVPGLLYLVRKRLGDVAPLLVMIVGFGFLSSLMFSNVGLIYRQRAQLLPWLLIIAAVGLERHKLHRSRRDDRPVAPEIPGPARKTP